MLMTGSRNKAFLIFAFFCGLGSSLFVPTPFGRVAMFDLLSYVIAPVILAVSYRRYTRPEISLLVLAFLWFLGTCYSNWWREEPFDVALKGDAIILNVFCMLIVGIALIRRSVHSFLWFSVGYGMGCVVALYVFQNGAYLNLAEATGYSGGGGGMQEYLVEKQVYPLYAQALFLSALFPLRVHKVMPWALIAICCATTAFLLLFHGGSRSGFGIYFLTSTVVFAYAYFRNVVRAFSRNALFFLVCALLISFVAFKTYAYLAQQGALGEAEYTKYVREIEDSESGVLGSRDDLIRAWPFLKHHPFVGAGSSAIDRWGYIVDSDDFRIPGHSALVGAWTQNGILGLIFWAHAIFRIIDFIRKRMIGFGDWFPFLAFILVSIIWAILFSPFGGYRGIVCVVLALCAVTSSPAYINELCLKKRASLDGVTASGL